MNLSQVASLGFVLNVRRQIHFGEGKVVSVEKKGLESNLSFARR